MCAAQQIQIISQICLGLVLISSDTVMLSPFPSSDALDSYEGSKAQWWRASPSWEAGRSKTAPRKPLTTREDLTCNIAWHTVSQQPLAEPKVKSISVHVDGLERWQRKWIEWNERHASPDDDDCIYL